MTCFSNHGDGGTTLHLTLRILRFVEACFVTTPNRVTFAVLSHDDQVFSLPLSSPASPGSDDGRHASSREFDGPSYSNPRVSSSQVITRITARTTGSVGFTMGTREILAHPAQPQYVGLGQVPDVTPTTFTIVHSYLCSPFYFIHLTPKYFFPCFLAQHTGVLLVSRATYTSCFVNSYFNRAPNIRYYQVLIPVFCSGLSSSLLENFLSLVP